MTDKSILFLNAWKMLAPEYFPPEAEFRFAPPRKWRADWGFPEYHVLVEVDGGVWLKHGGRHGTDQDRDKLNHAAALGYRVLRFSPEMLERDPQGCVDIVIQALMVK
jgi:very-short-patch-repair endonuclease